MRERLVEGETARVRRIDVLRDGQPLDQHRAVPRDPLELGDRVSPVRVNRCAVQKPAMPPGHVAYVIVRDLEVRAPRIALSVGVVHAVECEHDRRIDRTRPRDRSREKLLQRALGVLILAGEPELPAHEPKRHAVEQRPRHVSAAGRERAEMDVTVYDHTAAVFTFSTSRLSCVDVCNSCEDAELICSHAELCCSVDALTWCAELA